jgi:carboxypeptidase C (cathepsin A)
MLYIEAPVGVGFSYSDRGATDYRTNDDLTATDNLAGLAKFYELWPEFKSNPFFITGESYAGIYVPTLAEAIMWATGNGTWTGPRLNGIAVGNGCTGNRVGVCGGQREVYETKFLLGQAFIPQSLKDRIVATCDFVNGFNASCRTLTSQMSTTVGHVNIYNIFGDCISGALAEKGRQHKVPMDEPSAFGPDACIDSHAASAYLNRADVIAASHVVKQPFQWAVCGNQIQYSSTRANLPRDTYPALIKFTDVLIYNGDWDACVPYTDNEAWTSGMGFPVDKPWHAWTYNTNQVGGYATSYRTGGKSFTFTTVRGGRHEVPETAPRQAFEMFRRFVTGTPF